MMVKQVSRQVVVAVAAAVLMGAGALAMAEPPHQEAHGDPHAGPAMAAKGEPHPGPKGYSRVEPPKGWNARPASFDKKTFQHNFQAARSFKVGPYHRPAGWVAQHWGYGQILPRTYWAPEYILADYWLFSLEVPPAGYEWVRSDSDALLIDVNSGEILQVEYGVFS
jgi:Ni/Co efflux regulator RcnB